MAKYFSYGPDNVDSLLATTKSVLADMGDFLEDAIFTNMAFLNLLRQKSEVGRQGGATILVGLMTSKNTTAGWYSGYDSLDTTPQSSLTMAQYRWRSAAVSVSISNDEELDNSGEAQRYNLLKAKIQVGQLSLQDVVNQAFFASSREANAINTLVELVDTSSTIADIDSSANSWWQSQSTTGGSFATQGLAKWLTTYNNILKQGTAGGVPDIFVTTQSVMEYYERSQMPQQRYLIQGGNQKLADAGFDSLKYKGATVVFDPNCNSGVTYLLPSKNIKMIVNSKARFAMTDWVKPANQTARVAQIVFRANLVSNNRRKLGKVTSQTA